MATGRLSSGLLDDPSRRPYHAITDCTASRLLGRRMPLSDQSGLPAPCGTYTVNSDCTGRAAVHNGMTATFRLMLVERGQEVNIIESDQGVVAAGQITRQELQRCSNATFRGVYGFAASGSFFASPGTPSELFDLAIWARIVADGRGHATQQTSASVNGAYSETNETAMYTVNPDCTGSYTIFHANGTTEHVN